MKKVKYALSTFPCVICGRPLGTRTVCWRRGFGFYHEGCAK